MKLALVCAIVALMTLCSVSASKLFTAKEIENHFGNFKSSFRRIYRSLPMEEFRKQIFAENLEFIEKFNMDPNRDFKTYRLDVNNFTDLSPDEFHRLYNGYIHRTSWVDRTIPFRMFNVTAEMRQNLPQTVDWTQEGVVTPVKNQGQCGSCWTFSAIAAIESQLAMQTGRLTRLSEQNLLDCAIYGNSGCAGGLMTNAFEYIIQNGGVDTEDSYPYIGVQRYCRFNRYSVGASISSYANIQQGNERELMYAVANIGPISVAIDASKQSFQFYGGGVYSDPSCSPTQLNHGVTLVGYGTTTDGIPYWKIKNSWGAGWGMGGYILIRRGNNLCGVATQASYPVL